VIALRDSLCFSQLILTLFWVFFAGFRCSEWFTYALIPVSPHRQT